MTETKNNNNNNYNYSPKHNRKVTIDASKDGRTQQHLKDECDINRIMERHRVTGMVTHLAKGEPQYGDFSNLGDYQDALNTMIRAEEAFMSLDAHVRRKFDNNPQQLIDYLEDSRS